MKWLKRKAIEAALLVSKGSVPLAAKLLGVSHTTVDLRQKAISRGQERHMDPRSS